MKFQVELLYCVGYNDKTTKEPKTSLTYRMLDPKMVKSTDKLKGYMTLTVYCDTHKLFNALKPEYFGAVAELEVIEQPNPNNPMRRTMLLKAVKVGNELINLL